MTKKKVDANYKPLSILITIFSIVIGAGIFFKTDSVYQTTGSVIVAISSWVITGVFVIIISIAIFEVATVTKKTGESGTLSNWSSRFIGPKFGSYVGLMLIFINIPLTIVPLTQFTISYISSAAGDPEIFNEVWFNIIIAGSILILVTIINLFSDSSSRIAQMFGYIIKIAPILILIYASFAVMIISPSDSISSIASIVSPEKNQSLQDFNFWTTFRSFLVTVPAILFAFGGFIEAASLQNETGKKGSFRKWLILSMVMLVLLYTILIVGTYGAGDPSAVNSSGDDAFNVSTVLDTVFKNSPWVSDFVSITIAISVLSATNAYLAPSNRAFKSLSETNLINDKNKKYQKSNIFGAPYNSALSIFFINIGWFIALYLISGLTSIGQSGFYVDIIYVVSEFAIVITMTIMAIIFIGALNNRKTEKVDVEKSIWFKPAAVISIIFIFMVDIVYIYDLIDTADGWYNYAIVGLIFFVGFAIYILNHYQVKKLNKKFNNKWILYQTYVEYKKSETDGNFNYTFENIEDSPEKQRDIINFYNNQKSLEIIKWQENIKKIFRRIFKIKTLEFSWNKFDKDLGVNIPPNINLEVFDDANKAIENLRSKVDSDTLEKVNKDFYKTLSEVDKNE